MDQFAQLMDHKGEVRTGPDDTAPTIPSTGEAEILTKKAENDLVQCELNLQYGSKHVRNG